MMVYSVFDLNKQQDIAIDDEQWQQNIEKQEILLRYFAFPIKQTDEFLWLAIDSLQNINACETFSFLTAKQIEPILISTSQLKFLLEQLSPNIEKTEELAQVIYTPELTTATQYKVAEKADEPVINLLNELFEKSLKKKASDIHLEPLKNKLQVRFRIDGVLQLQNYISHSLQNRVITRLKLLANLDINETRIPQDGSFQHKTKYNDQIDFRISTLPIPMGEKVVLRVQQNKPVSLSFHALGMDNKQQAIFKKMLLQPQGLILVTGPTGSGKSISLYTALQWLNTNDNKHILTAEDPIEVELEGIMQSQVNHAVGLSFSQLLRAFLRQDPDIIMLGEIRDEESASIALRASQTGHLVLSTLHTNDAPSALSRLRQLAISEHEIQSTLLLVIAQRLIRKSCQHDKEVTDANCNCVDGYSGREGIYQFLMPYNKNGIWSYELDYANLKHSVLEITALFTPGV